MNPSASFRLKKEGGEEANTIVCQVCKKQYAEIFQITGDYCLQCWMEATHPDIGVKGRGARTKNGHR